MRIQRLCHVFIFVLVFPSCKYYDACIIQVVIAFINYLLLQLLMPIGNFVLLAGIEWSLDNDASNAAVLVASEAHAITLAVEGLLGVVFTVATLTDEAVDVGEVSVYI